MRLRTSSLLAALAALATAGAAEAADFTFNVPIDVQNMAAEITEGKVECFVTEPGATGSPTGTGQQFFGLDSFGNFQQTISVAVNVDAGADPGAVSGFGGVLALKDSSGQFQGIGSAFESEFVDQSTTTTRSVSGDITPQTAGTTK